MAVGVNRRHPLRRILVHQVDHLELAAARVLMPGLYCLIGRFVSQAELPARDIGAAQADNAQGPAACALPALTRQHQQGAVADLGGAVVLLGQTGDEVEIRLVELIDPQHLGQHRTRRLPAIARGDITDDPLQRDVLPAAAARGFATSAHVTRLASNDHAVGRSGQFDFIHGIAPQTGQRLAGVAQMNLDGGTACR
ncbi:hypothetical protein D3C80_1048760 [compost metagenome]